jgi:protein-S-isoprenylcysteine O-methyltransferase Ste14
MNPAIALLVNVNYWVIGILPMIFFRRDGSFNLRWWITAAPLFVMPVYVVAAWLTGDPRLGPMVSFGFAQDAAALFAATTSIGLMTFTLGTHRTRLALWHQNNDAPESIVTYGAYRRIRHPFYTSFILATLGGAILIPHPATVAFLLWAWIGLDRTAAGEEKRLAASKFGAEYTEYLKRTGRFFPRLGAEAAS